MAGQAIANPECLIDCFSKGSDYDSACFSSLTEDVATKGTCDTGDNPAHELDIWGWSELENNCVLEEVDYYDYYYGEYFSGSVTLAQCPAGRVFQYRVGSGMRQNTGYRVGFG